MKTYRWMMRGPQVVPAAIMVRTNRLLRNRLMPIFLIVVMLTGCTPY